MDDSNQVSGKPVIALSGTTASGKNATGVELARRLDGEILSLDSMKVYRGMDLGTDKPSAELRREVPHHLVDILGPHEAMNLHRFVEDAHAITREVFGRGKQPIVVGGTALYLTGYLRGVVEGAPRDEAFRHRFRAAVEAGGLAAQHARLCEVDPRAGGRIHPNDAKRIERALEVFELTGKPLSEQQSQWTQPARIPHRLFILTWPREVLYRRIDHRVEAMFEGGLLDEVRAILAAEGFGEQAAEGIGYREVLAHLRGEIPHEEALRRTQSATRRFARKQMTWFRGMPEVRWIEGREGEGPPELAARILEQLSEG